MQYHEFGVSPCRSNCFNRLLVASAELWPCRVRSVQDDNCLIPASAIDMSVPALRSCYLASRMQGTKAWQRPRRRKLFLRSGPRLAVFLCPPDVFPEIKRSIAEIPAVVLSRPTHDPLARSPALRNKCSRKEPSALRSPGPVGQRAVPPLPCLSKFVPA